MATAITIDKTAIAAFCRRNYITRLSLFGSVLRDDFHDGSDIDVLVTFDSEHIPGFFRLNQMQAELSELLEGYKVDLVTRKSLNHRIRDNVLATAEVLYGEA